VDTVVLIGGSSRIPLVLRSISDTLPAQPIQLKEWDQRDFAVALGAAYHAQKLWGKQPFSPPRPGLPPPPPGEELYRGIVIRTWMPTRRLTRTQAAELANEASKLGIDITAAAVVERGVMGYTKEEVLQQQHYAALARYRTAVNKVWQKKILSQSQVIALDAEMKALELGRDEVAIIERE